MIAGIRRLLGLQSAEPGRYPVRHAVVADPTPQDVAAIQAAAPDWLVMWCWWRREYTALARFGAEPTVIYDRDPARLLRRCREIELAAAYGRQATIA
ncbi:hypothetical protein GCM10029978_118780 [Actinoallomurus acanthiterrae]